MSQNSDQMIPAYISTFYVHTNSFHGKPTSFMSHVKKTKISVKKGLSWDIFFCLFYTRRKKCWVFTKLGVHTYNIEMYTSNLCSEFFDISKYIFQCQEHMLPFAKMNFRYWKWHSIMAGNRIESPTQSNQYVISVASSSSLEEEWSIGRFRASITMICIIWCPKVLEKTSNQTYGGSWSSPLLCRQLPLGIFGAVVVLDVGVGGGRASSSVMSLSSSSKEEPLPPPSAEPTF